MKPLSRLAVIVMLACAALAASAAPAFADTARGPVPSPATIGGVSLFGLPEADARAAILANTANLAFAPLQIACGSTTRTVDPAGAVVVDANAMLDEAYSSVAVVPFELTPRYAVDPAVVSGWLAPFSAALDRAAVSSRYVVSGRALAVTPSASGQRLDVTAGASDVTAALRAAIAAGGAAQLPVTLQSRVVAPAVSEATIGRAILVVLSRYRVHSYSGGRVEKTYRCAIGMRRYPTPTGTFRIVAKQKMPSWNNPGSAWARRMPRRIKPGPNNPLGTRALYLNAGGIRIHGTSQTRSIGRAASHGCIRLVRKDIEALFPRIPVGTTVFIVK